MVFALKWIINYGTLHTRRLNTGSHTATVKSNDLSYLCILYTESLGQ